MHSLQVSDALLKLEKVPEGASANAGFLADLGELTNYTHKSCKP